MPLGSVGPEKECSFVTVSLHHKSGYLPYLFRFNTTLVRRVQPIYRRIAGSEVLHSYIFAIILSLFRRMLNRSVVLF